MSDLRDLYADIFAHVIITEDQEIWEMSAVAMCPQTYRLTSLGFISLLRKMRGLN